MEKYFLLFMCYSIMGWIIEVITGFIEKGKFINRGFLIGPYCPIYGFGGLSMTLLLTKYINDKLILFVMSIAICSVIEYLTSYVMEKMFHTRWWDYSNKKYNINGRICLETMIPFGILGILTLCYINPFLYSVFEKIPSSIFNVAVIILIILYILDNIISFRIIFGLEDIKLNINEDSTEKITEQVKKIIENGNRELYNRLITAFPHIQIFKNHKK